MSHNMKHRYLIGVAIHPMTIGIKAGQMFLKYGPIHFTKDQVNDVKSAIDLANDKLLPNRVSQKEANDIYGVSSLTHSIHGFLLSLQFNDATAHLFQSDYKIDEEWFLMLIKGANKGSSYFKDLLTNSRIR